MWLAFGEERLNERTLGLSPCARRRRSSFINMLCSGCQEALQKRFVLVRGALAEAHDDGVERRNEVERLAARAAGVDEIARRARRREPPSQTVARVCRAIRQSTRPARPFAQHESSVREPILAPSTTRRSATAACRRRACATLRRRRRPARRCARAGTRAASDRATRVCARAPRRRLAAVFRRR